MTSQSKAVFFDLDGTLRIPTPGPTAAFIQFARSLDIEISADVEKRVKIWAHRYWGQDDLIKEDMERFGANDFWINYSRLLLETVDVSYDLMTRARLIREWFDQKYRPDVALVEGCLETLNDLREAGFILGVISNRFASFHSELRALGLDGYFDIALAAGEIGHWKPNPMIFHYVLKLEQFGALRAEDCFYVGDNFYADCLGAEAAGLRPILYDPEDLYDDPAYPRLQRMDELSQLLLNGTANGRYPAAKNEQSKNGLTQANQMSH